MDEPIEMDETENEELHTVIEIGDFDRVRSLLPENVEGQLLLFDGRTALIKALSCKKYEIASYLIHKGAKYDASEVYDLYDLRIDLARLNLLLLEYNRKTEKSCIYQLVSWSQSPQGLDGERLRAVISMYEDLFESETIRLLMKVLESEAFDLVYDFDSEDINRIHRLEERETETFGLTLSEANEIFIGAKNLLCEDSLKAKVYGVVAEELCHLALTTLFKNDAKPYEEEDSSLIEEFGVIVLAVRSLVSGQCPVESVIQDVFWYDLRDWECELIARVPHVIGIYGEELGRGKFKEYPELSNVLSFYDRNVIPKCRMYTDPLLNRKPHRLMEKITKKNKYISLKDKQIPPLKEGFPSFGKHLGEGISVITTNCEKLCMLQIYHELKKEYGEVLEKKCLFLTGNCFERKKDEILGALKVNIWEYFVLVLDKEGLSVQKFQDDHLDDLEELETEGMKIIIVSSSRSLGKKFPNKTVKYKWNDLSDGYKTHLQTVTYIFKGEEESEYIPKEMFLDVFDEEDVRRMIGGDVFQVDDGPGLFSQGYVPEIYVERELWATAVDKKILNDLPPDTCVFISGLCERYFKMLSMDEKSTQWIKAPNEQLQDRSIFINKGGMTFENFVEKSSRNSKIWLRHIKGEFYLCDSDGSCEALKKHTSQVTYTEEAVLKYLRNNRFMIISDNAGCGKSTVISGIIGQMKEKIAYSHLVFRIDLSKFCRSEKEPVSLAHIKESSSKEDVFDQLYEMLGLRNGLEKWLFNRYSGKGASFIFFDGFDEVGPKFERSTLKLLSVLNEKTAANVAITTRKHRQRVLEETLQTHSHQLVPFSADTQVKYLVKLWKWKLKFPCGNEPTASQKDKKAVASKVKKIVRELEKKISKLDMEYHDLVLGLGELELENDMDSIRSEIDKLDFSSLAKHILCKTSLDETMLQCMGIPLHLYMAGVVHYDGNFNVEIQSDISDLYSQFVEQKVLIYIEEKKGLVQESSFKDDNIEEVTKDTYRIHIQLADQLLDQEKVCQASEMNKKDLELCSAIGIVIVQAGIKFIHQTFAEFFKAESLRQKTQQGIFMDVLFEDRYNIVRRFLSSALKKKDFEELGEGVIQDVDFFAAVVEKIVNMPPTYGTYNADHDTFCLLKIVRKLLGSFEKSVGEDLMSQFRERTHGLIMKQKKKGNRRHHKYMYQNNVGGCLTVRMLKNLMFKNFKVYFFICFNFVRFSDSPAEVIEVLEKCIYIHTDGERGCQQGKSDKQKAAEARRLLKLLSTKISHGRSLLYHAACNGRAEIFARLLKLFRDVFKRNQFVRVIVESDDYRDMMKGFIEAVNINRTCKLLKELHSVFGNEMEILFDKDSKVCAIDQAIIDESVEDIFQKVTCLFSECFGRGDLKELLQGTDFMHTLFNNCSSKTLLKNMSVIKDILDGEGEMKQFMKSMDRDHRNVFHLAVEQDRHFSDLMLYIGAEFRKDEIEDILLSSDYQGRNVMHYLFEYSSSEELMEKLNTVEGILGDEERLKHLLQSKEILLKNAFHLAAEKDLFSESLLVFYDAHLEKEEIMSMLLSVDLDGNNPMISSFQKSSFDGFMKALAFIDKIVGGGERLNQILSIKDQYSKNMFHLSVLRDRVLAELLQFSNARFEKTVIMEHLLSTDKDGHNVVHSFFARNSSVTFMKNLNVVKNVLDDDGMLRQLLATKDGLSRNLFHLAILRDAYLEELWEFCNAHFEKDEVTKMLLDVDQDGSNVMHCSFMNNTTETLVKNLDLVKHILGDDGRFNRLLKSENRSFQTILHFAAKKRKEMSLSFLDSYLSRVEIVNLLIGKDEDGRTCLHVACDYETLHILLSYADEMLQNDRRRFEELILEKDNYGYTVLHCLVKGLWNEGKIQLVENVLIALERKLPAEVYGSLLRERNRYRETFLQRARSGNKPIYKLCKKKFGMLLFEELLEFD